jgi:hypothetical protein
MSAAGDTRAALDAAEAFIKRFCVLPSAEAYDAVSLWVAHTWLFCDQWPDQTPYLIVTSPVRQCGKTRLIELIAQMVWQPWTISSAPTGPVLFRRIESGVWTVLFDEVDELFKKRGEDIANVVSILNAGNLRSGSVPRCEGPTHEPRDYSVFSAKLLGGIDASRWPDTITDRGITIELRRKTAAQDVERYQRRDEEEAVLLLQEQMTKLRDEAIINQVAAIRPDVILEISDRAFDGWEPLLAIGMFAGDDWAVRARAAALKLNAAGEKDDGALAITLLRDIASIVDGLEHVTSNDLLSALNGLPESPWADQRQGKGLNGHQLAKFLQPFQIHSKTIRTADGTLKGFKIDQFTDSFESYLGATPANSRHTVTTGINTDDQTVTRNVTTEACDGVCDAGNPDKDCDVTVLRTKQGVGDQTDDALTLDDSGEQCVIDFDEDQTTDG